MVTVLIVTHQLKDLVEYKRIEKQTARERWEPTTRVIAIWTGIAALVLAVAAVALSSWDPLPTFFVPLIGEAKIGIAIGRGMIYCYYKPVDDFISCSVHLPLWFLVLCCAAVSGGALVLRRSLSTKALTPAQDSRRPEGDAARRQSQ